MTRPRLSLPMVTAALIVLAGCAPGTNDRATPSPTVDPTPDYPDTSDFVAVNAADYRVSYPYMNGILLTTPDGLSCGYNAMNSLNDPNVAVANCWGRRPGLGPGEWTVAAATNKVATAEQAPPALNPTYQSDQPVTGKLLPARHKIAYRGIECSVDGNGMTACRTGEHGFVLTPTETKLF